MIMTYILKFDGEMYYRSTPVLLSTLIKTFFSNLVVCSTNNSSVTLNFLQRNHVMIVVMVKAIASVYTLLTGS